MDMEELAEYIKTLKKIEELEKQVEYGRDDSNSLPLIKK